jgi:AraC family transcriptional regulator
MTANSWADRILRVLDAIHAGLDGELDPRSLAGMAGFSLHHFHRVFRGMVGESVMQYVRRHRLERAAFRLRYTGGDVATVAFAHGYESHEAFTRAFRAHFGMPPSVYRDRHQDTATTGARIDPTMAVRRVAPERRVLACRFTGPYDACAPAWEQLMAFATSVPGVRLDRPTLGLVYDDPEITAPDRCRYDAAVEIDADVAMPPLPPGLVERTVSGGTYAVIVHAGAYETILDSYVSLLGGWLPRQGWDLADEPVVERYLVPFGTVAPDQLRTEVCVRLS